MKTEKRTNQGIPLRIPSARLLRMGLGVWLLLGAAWPAWTQIRFTHVGDETNVNIGCNTHGSGFFDYNGDGWDDIFIVHNVSVSTWGDMNHFLLKNQEGVDFFDVSYAAGVAGFNVSAQGLAAADYDNDGYRDIAVAMGNWMVLLYRNHGDGTFGYATEAANVVAYNRARNLFFSDYDNDGNVDLFLIGDRVESSVSGIVLYRNKGDGTFERRDQEAGLDINRSPADVYGAAVADIDNDGDADFYIPNNEMACNLFVNNGNGTFTDFTELRGLARIASSYGAIFIDYNNDGWFDLFVRRSGFESILYRNRGDGTFEDVSVEAGLSQIHPRGPYGGGLSVADFDNDGYMDIFMLSSLEDAQHIFRNNGDGTFSAVTDLGITPLARMNWSAPLADYDHDGYVDIFLARNEAPPPTFYATLFRNNGGSNHWVHFNLVGTASNRDGIGARLVAYAEDRMTMQQVVGGEGYIVNSFPVEFGLGQAPLLDSLIIYWPSGIVQREIGVPPDTLLTIEEQAATTYHRFLRIAGCLTYWNSGAFVTNTVTTMSGDLNDQQITDAVGEYSFLELMPESNIEVRPEKPDWEDVGDQVVSAYDAALTAMHVVGIQALSGYALRAADSQQDGVINMGDAASIARGAVGLEGLQGSEIGAWKFDPPLRQYPSVRVDAREEDYTAYLLGDVSGNWPGGGAGKAVGQSAYSVLEQQGDTLKVQVILSQDSNLLGGDFWLRYDPAVFAFAGAQATTLASTHQLVVNAQTPGLVRTALFGFGPLTQAGTIVIFQFAIQTLNVETQLVWERFCVNEQSLPQAELIVQTDVDERAVPDDFRLLGNYPNPFNPATVVRFSLPAPAQVRLEVFDVLGRQCRTLDAGWMGAGHHNLNWDGRDDAGAPLPSGLYLLRLRAGDQIRQIKAVKAQ